jgi:hypothetical protein
MALPLPKQSPSNTADILEARRLRNDGGIQGLLSNLACWHLWPQVPAVSCRGIHHTALFMHRSYNIVSFSTVQPPQSRHLLATPARYCGLRHSVWSARPCTER